MESLPLHVFLKKWSRRIPNRDHWEISLVRHLFHCIHLCRSCHYNKVGFDRLHTLFQYNGLEYSFFVVSSTLLYKSRARTTKNEPSVPFNWHLTQRRSKLHIFCTYNQYMYICVCTALETLTSSFVESIPWMLSWRAGRDGSEIATTWTSSWFCTKFKWIDRRWRCNKFSCGVHSLDDFFKRWGQKNRTFPGVDLSEIAEDSRNSLAPDEVR